MKDDSGRVIYVGKAINLKKRVSSYFRAGGDSRYQIRFLMNRVAAIDWIVTDTEKEALILENNLIKEHRPRYNLSLRDDKTYFSLRLDPREEFPRFTIIRKVPRDGARYFGPYASASAAREVLKELCRYFPLRHYPLKSCRQRSRPCLYYQLKQCSAPCFGRIAPEEYSTLVEGACLFLSGRSSEIVRIYRERMNDAAQRLAYEEAGRYRDLIRAMETTVERQKVAAVGGDSDVIGMASRGDMLQVSILFIRGGLLLGSRSYPFAWEMGGEEGLASFLFAYYDQEVIIPDEILLPIAIEGGDSLAELLSEKRGKRVSISTPRRGEKVALVQMAVKNAQSAALERERREEERGEVLEELQRRLHLEQLPARIECYDISNIHGTSAVGSRVTFRDGKPDKGRYRRYRIKTVGQADDFAMMREVLSRRFREHDPDDPPPDLIVVDGGQGQLGVLTAVMAELGMSGVGLAGLAKSRVAREMAGEEVVRSDERVFLPGRKNPVVLRQNSAPLLLLARIRDEAHRFAITYHRRLRGEAALASALDGIPGLGPAKRKALLARFGSVTAIAGVTLEELCSVKGITPALAGEIKDRLERQDRG